MNEKPDQTTHIPAGASANPIPLAIIGMGCLFPKADNLAAYWANIRDCVDTITEIPSTHWKPEDYFDADPKAPDMTYAKRGAFLSPVEFNPMEFGIAPNAIEATDSTQLLGLIAAREALKDAGYDPAKEFNRQRVSCILGVTGTLELVLPLGARLSHPLWKRALKDAGLPQDVINDVAARIAEQYVPWQEASFPGLLGNVVAGRIANCFDLGGSNCVVDAACASALGAINMAAMELISGRADMVVTGGMDTFNDIFMYMCFSKTPALSPTGDVRPFANNADGTILGEGLGAIILKRLDDAERDGDRIYAILKSIGSSSDGKGMAIYAPRSEGQSLALRRAYETGGVTPETIELIEAHGTGTKAGDAAELGSLVSVFTKPDEKSSWCALGSVKSQIGHTKAAAGVAGLIKAALGLYHKVLPPTAKVKEPSSTLLDGKTAFYVNTTARPWLPRPTYPRRAGVSAFGFGGSNFHCLLEEYETEKTVTDWDGNVQIVAFSGKTEVDVAQSLANFAQQNPTDTNGLPKDWKALRNSAAHSRSTFRNDANCRLTLSLQRNKTDINTLLTKVTAQLKNTEMDAWNLPIGAWYARGEKPGDIAILFPGQGGTRTGMMRDLTLQFPEVFQALEQANAALGCNSKPDEPRLSDRIFPPTVFEQANLDANEAALRATDVAQPAIGALSIGAWDLLKRFGVEADVFAGHSYGELAALCAAGRFDAATLYRLSRLRGELMASGEGDKGAMLAVNTDLKIVKSVIAEDSLDVIIANHNAPQQYILSGSTPAIETATKAFASRKIRVTRLAVAAAFHSKFIAQAREPFLKALKKESFTPAECPVFSNTTAEEYPESDDDTRELLAKQLASPVEFIREIEAMYLSGVRTFVEVGPGKTLTGLLSSILEGRDFHAVATDNSRGKRPGQYDLACLLAQLAALGYGIQLPLWDTDADPSIEDAKNKKPVFTIPICGANYMKPRTPKPPVTNLQIGNAPQAPAQPQPVAAAAPQQPSINGQALALALQATQENMAALQQIQEQTAHLHNQYLQGQDTAQRSLQALILQQQQIVQSTLGTPMASIMPMPSQQTPPPRAVPIITPPPAPLPQVAPLATPTEASASSIDKIESVLLGVIAEKTGYPTEMLDLSMGLDSDLGIDSIKRVEILSALQEELPDAPAIKPEQLGAIQTLNDIVEFLVAEMPTAPASQVTAPVSAVATPAALVESTRAEEVLLEVIAEKTGYPVEMLDLDMGLDSDLGIDSIKRVEILSALQERIPEAPAVKPEQLGALQTLRDIVGFLSQGTEAPTTTPETTPATPTADNEAVTQALLEIIAEKTGYPIEMLDLSMGLDADLGIDSIKRVEILSALQERMPDLPTIKPEHLGTLQTLGEIVDFLTMDATPHPTTNASATEEPTLINIKQQEKSQTVPREIAAETPSQEQNQESPTAQHVQRYVVHATRMDERIKREEIPLPPNSEIWIMSDGSDLAWSLREYFCALKFLPKLIKPHDLKRIKPPESLGGLLILSPLTETSDVFLEDAFRTVQFASRSLRNSADSGGACLLTVSRMDGCFGLRRLSAESNPLSGGLAGLAKTAGQEWKGVSCKAIDLASDFVDLKGATVAIVEEMFQKTPSEVGITNDGRWTLELKPEQIAPEQMSEMPLKPNDVVVVTGGARGVTAETCIAFARAFQPTLILLGRSREPEPEPDWLAPLTTEASIKKALLQNADSKASPKQIGEAYSKVSANREMLQNIERIRNAGSQVVYRSVDVRHANAIATALEDVRHNHGPIKGLIHGAGVLADRLIEDKTEQQFEMVYETKVNGLRSFLDAMGDDDLRLLALFSSSTARFGRSGQVDYAIANEVLNKLAQQQANMRPNCRVVSVNWGPWAGGMVTPSLKGVFAAEGIGLINMEAGARHLVKESCVKPGPQAAIEVIILGEGSTILPLPEPTEPSSPAPSKPESTTNTPASELALSFERNLSVKDCPILRSHVLDGKAVLPTAIIIEWLAHGALHANPGLKFLGFDELRILKGATLEPGANLTLEILAAPGRLNNANQIVAPAEIRSTAPNGTNSLHARANIVMGDQLQTREKSSLKIHIKSWPAEKNVYENGCLFHGIDMHCIQTIEGCSSEGIVATINPAPAPSKWFANPARNTWIADPCVLDGAFQMIIVWSVDNLNLHSLPVHARRYRQFCPTFPKGGVLVVAKVTAKSEFKAVADIEFLDPETKEMIAFMEGYECVIDASLSRAFQRNQLSE